jgi:hypothetical protein
METKKMQKKLFIFTIPIIVLIDIYLLTLCVEMIREKSDIQVLLSVLLFSFIVSFNYYLINFIKSIFKK